MMEPGTERELDYTERLFKKMPGWAVTATLFIGRTLIRVGRAGKKLWNKRKENQQRAFLTQLCEGKNGSEIEKIIKADPKLAKLIEPKKRGLIGRIIDKVRGITPEARQNKWKDKLLQQPLHKFDKNLLKPLMNENEVIRDKVLSENRFLGSIDPNARKVYQATLKDTTNQRAFVTQLCAGNPAVVEALKNQNSPLLKLNGPKKRGWVGRMIDKARGITPEARQRELLQQPLKKFNKLALEDLITRDDNKVIEDRVNSHIKFKGSIDPVARVEYKTNLIDAKIQAQNAKKRVNALDVGNTMSRKGELSKLTDLTKHAIPKAARLTAENQRTIGGNTLTKGLQGQLLQAPVR
ncbi:hypothetical protein SE1_02409 [Enterococcus hirae EnGen0127]|uniref:hypothetical protein n=1 Tax=Enterococcus hirae TaxID=1354 RepID=UPI0003310EFF|nr:hypothetical protein [Enterococcus hirae]EOF55794.1 hypothetical protein SE1_02409 [Enterococcus hirae EnGen0127]